MFIDESCAYVLSPKRCGIGNNSYLQESGRLYSTSPGATSGDASSVIQDILRDVERSILPMAAAISLSVALSQSAGAKEKVDVTLADLPYDYKALEPYIGEQTLRIHHGKHHAKYVATTNSMIKGTDMEGDDVVTIIRKANGKNQALFNNAAQSWNHAFYWQNMKPNGGGEPTGKLAAMINKDFGSYAEFRKQFTAKALTAFGSGWAWLTYSPSKGLQVSNSIGANTPIADKDSTPLLTVDVWEHAYYLDYQNMRNVYVDAFMDKLVNWEAVAKRLPV